MKTVLSIGLMLAAILSGSAAQAVPEPSSGPIRSRIVESSNKKISCYALKHRDAVHCRGPRHSADSKKVIELAKHGRTKHVRVTDYPGYRSEPRTLRHGQTWKRNGVTCTLRRSTITCFNLEGHGFHLGRRATTTF